MIPPEVDLEQRINATFLQDADALLLISDCSPENFRTVELRQLFERIAEDHRQHGAVDPFRIGKQHVQLQPLIADLLALPKLNGELPAVIARLKAGNITATDVGQFRFKPMTSEEIKQLLSLTIKHDDENKLLAFQGMLAAYTEDSQVNLMFNAPSSSGKSFIPMEAAKLFPPEDVLQFGGASPTAFFHSGKFDKEQDTYIVDLERKILIFLDQPNPQLLERLRALLSHDEKVIEYRITDKTQRGGTRTKRILLKGFCSVVFCTASLKTDEQEATRCFLLSPETNQQKLQAGIVQKLRKESDPETFDRWLETDPGRRMLKERIRAIRDAHITEIKIGRDEENLIAGAFLKTKMLKPRHQRDIGRIISLVKTFALLNLWWRDRIGSTITANEADVDEAISLWEKIAEAQELNLAPYVYQFFREIIVPAFEELNSGQAGDAKTGLGRKAILIKHSKVYGRPLAMEKLRFEILPQLECSGLIVQESDPLDRRNKLVYPTTTTNTIS